MRQKTVFICTECGFKSAKWYGKCSGCGAWNTLKEETFTEGFRASLNVQAPGIKPPPVLINDVCFEDELRIKTGISEFDRVLGGGAVKGSLILVSGEPGIGKSTLLLQACRKISESSKVLYVSGEESLKQVKLRAVRVLDKINSLYLLSETNVDLIIEASLKLSPEILIIDSIQTIYKSGLDTTPGNITQIRECVLAVMEYAKTHSVTVFVVGHVNKDGAIAGPKVMEHMVDCVMYLEGERHINYRMLRAVKNRYGSTDEIGVFEMSETGLKEVLNPSEALLSGRPGETSGSCVACAMEGSRPILAEVQALVTKTVFGVPRRVSTGIDYNRSVLLLAILEKRAGLYLSSFDAYINVVGGLKLNEPSVDLPTVIAIASSYRDKPVRRGIAAFGEIGLTGELRAVSFCAQRLNEIKRLGFSECIIPRHNMKNIKEPQGLELIYAKNINEALAAAF